MNIDYDHLSRDLESGLFRQRLEEELTSGFQQLHQAGERLPVASHLASQIAEIVDRNADLSENEKYELYQEILDACTNAREKVLGDEGPKPS